LTKFVNYFSAMQEIFQCYMFSPVGWIEIKSTDAVILAISFREKESDEPNMEHPLLREAVNQLQLYFDGRLKHFDLPLQPEGTAFQQTVWKWLQEIEYGKTISYLQLSRQVGDEKAIRAVGSANGKNPLGIVIPCHRVIGSDGSLVGYAGKVWRKKWLLEHENAIVSKQLQLF
jgi:methylated-DNA-[protein]-cysteine S-methyltransferase